MAMENPMIARIIKSRSTVEAAIEFAKKAIDADRDEKYEEALISYKKTIQYFLHALRYEIRDDKAQLKASINEQCDRYLARADELKQYLVKKQKGEPVEKPISAINYDEAIEAAKRVTDAEKDNGISGNAMDLAIDLVKKATDADKDKKYYEMNFLEIKPRCMSVRAKCDQCLMRADQLKQYIKKQKKEGGSQPVEKPSAINYDEAIEAAKRVPVTIAEKDKEYGISGNALETAINLMKKATDADTDKKYHEALTLYEHALQYFLQALKDEVHGDKAKTSVRIKCDQCLTRTDQLKLYLKKQKKAGLEGSQPEKPSAMNRAIEAAKRAADADRNVKYEEALILYGEASQYMMHAIKYEIIGDSSKRAKAREQCDEYLSKVEELKRYFKKK